MPTTSSRAAARSRASLLRHLLVGVDRVDDLVADGHHRVERVHRALEDHRDLAPAEAGQLGVAHGQHVLAAQEDVAAGDDRRRMQDAGDGVGDGRFAAAGLAGQSEHLPRTDGEGDAVDGPHRPLGRQVLDAQVAHVEQGGFAVCGGGLMRARRVEVRPGMGDAWISI